MLVMAIRKSSRFVAYIAWKLVEKQAALLFVSVRKEQMRCRREASVLSAARMKLERDRSNPAL